MKGNNIELGYLYNQFWKLQNSYRYNILKYPFSPHYPSPHVISLDETSCERCETTYYCTGDGARRPCGRCTTTDNSTCDVNPTYHSFGAADQCSPCPTGWVRNILDIFFFFLNVYLLIGLIHWQVLDHNALTSIVLFNLPFFPPRELYINQFLDLWGSLIYKVLVLSLTEWEEICLQSFSIMKMMRLLTLIWHGHFLKLTRHMKPSTMRKR